MQILVTGSTGFVGQALVNELIKKDEVTRVFGVNRKIGLTPESITRAKPEAKLLDVYAYLDNEAYVQSLFRAVKPDIIFHLAASQSKSPEAFESNVRMTNYITKHCPTSTRLVYVSSSTVYGSIAEDLYDYCGEFCKTYEEDITVPTNLYGVSKVCGEGLVRLAGKRSYVILRPCSIIGRGATHGLLPDLLSKLKSDQPSLKLFGPDPGSLKGFLHINDLVAGLIYFGLGDFTDIYNLSANDELTVKQVANLAMKELKLMKPIEWVDNQIVGDNRIVALSNTKAIKAGWTLKYSTSGDAIKEIINEVDV